jgi:hypothetical protein
MDNRSPFCDLFIYLRSECVSASRVRVAPLKACRVRLNGQLRPDVNAKDVVLYSLARPWNRWSRDPATALAGA